MNWKGLLQIQISYKCYGKSFVESWAISVTWDNFIKKVKPLNYDYKYPPWFLVLSLEDSDGNNKYTYVIQ